ncbi:uncharacterized protein G6M90_00g110480 [Metarhizium brunneum]|uniref:Uncharacterized protein n=1 Tax=Metarhizium brunneum TaxID=500148 RepID=A0A7D5Z0U8_9HYPO
MSLHGVVQKLLLGLEFCLSVTAVVCFVRELPEHANDEKMLGHFGCNVDLRTGLCFASNPEAIETVTKMNSRARESNFGLAILSLVVVLVRFVSWRLNYSPRYANLVYDLLLSGLWCFNLVRQFTSTELAGCRYEHVGQIAELGICRLNVTCVRMATVAIVLYSGRVLVDVKSIMESDHSILLHEKRWAQVESGDGYEDELQKAQAGSFSPVLAFFPDTHREI